MPNPRKLRYVFLNQRSTNPTIQGAPAPQAPAQLESVLEDKERTFSTPERFYKAFDHPSTQSAFGLLGGVVGVLLDARYFALLSVLFNYSLIRTHALAGLRKKAKIVAHAATFILSFSLLFFAGMSINRKRPHVYTPTEYREALKAGTPLPITQQVTQITQKITQIERKKAPDHSHIVIMNGASVGLQMPLPNVNAGYRNGGEYLIDHSNLNSQVSYGDFTKGQCDENLFNEFSKSFIHVDGGGALEAHNPMSFKWHTASPTNQPSSSSQVLYIMAIVRWSDDSGIYETDYYDFYSFSEGQWHDCRNISGRETKISNR